MIHAFAHFSLLALKLIIIGEILGTDRPLLEEYEWLA